MEVDDLTCTETVVDDLSNEDSMDDDSQHKDWDSHGMREETPIEDEMDEEHEEDLRGPITTPEIRHRPGEYQFQLLPIHVEQRNEDSDSGGLKVYKCDICGMVYRHVFSLKRHFLRCHINYKYLTSTDITNCGIHMQVIHAAQSDLSNDDMYRCHICHHLFPEREQLKKHTESHADDKDRKSQTNGTFACNKCNASFADRKTLLRHQTTHGGPPLKKVGQSNCKYCGKNIPGQLELRRHERTHEATDTTCKVCKVSFSSTDYVEHKHSVHPDNNHLCSYCDAILQDVSSLTSHLSQTHGKSVSDNAQQIADKENGSNNHIKEEPLELEAKPDLETESYCCTLCKKNFTSMVNLQRHNTVVHIKPQDKRLPDSRLKTNGHHLLNRNNEEDFYKTLDQRISNNLQFYIDGRSPGRTQSSTTFEAERVESNNCMPWLVNNFPPTFDITHIVQIYASRPPLARPLATEAEDKTALSACLGLNPVKREVKPEIRTLFICQVCGHSTDTEPAIWEHKTSVHKNVVATHLELEGHSSVPAGLLPQFEYNKKGVLKSAEAPKSNDIHRCTKCNRTFAKIAHLHSHIVQCGQLSVACNFNNFLRPPSPRQIKQRKFGPVLNTKRCDDGAGASDYGKDDPRKKRKVDDRPQRRSARSTYTGGPSECTTCGQSFPSQASLRKHILDECREEPAYRKKKRKDSPTGTPEPIKISSNGSDGWGDDYLDGKGPDQYYCEACSTTFGGIQQFRRHLPQCSINPRTKTLMPCRTAPTTSSSTGMSRSQYEEMTVLGLVQRAERDRQRNFKDAGYEDHNDDDDVGDEEDTKVYRCPSCHMGFGDYVKMIHHSLHEHGTPIPDAQTFHRESNGLRNGASTYSKVNSHVVHEEMHEEEVHDDCVDDTDPLALSEEDELRLKERIAIEALSAFSSGGASFLNNLGLNNNHSNNNNSMHHNNNDSSMYGNGNKFSRPGQPLMDHRY